MISAVGIIGRAGDKTAAQLGQLAADFSFRRIAQQGSSVLFDQLHIGTTLGKSSHPATALTGQGQVLRRIGWIQHNIAPKGRLYRPNPKHHLGLEVRIAVLDQFLTTGNALLQDLRIIEACIDSVARCIMNISSFKSFLFSS